MTAATRSLGVIVQLDARSLYAYVRTDDRGLVLLPVTAVLLPLLRVGHRVLV